MPDDYRNENSEYAIGYDAGYEAALAEVYIFLQMFPAEQVKSIVKGLIGEEK